jgi:acyl carrier protein
METRNKIIEIIRAVSGKDVIPDPDESLFESGILDSFALPDLLSTLELEFSITIPDSDLSPRKFGSVARIESYIQSHV